MLYDRPYMRYAGEPESRQTSMVTVLLVVTIAVHVLQHLLNVLFPGYGGSENRFLSNWFALSGENFRELKVWTVFSYGLLHSTGTILHIVGNMLGLFFIGRILEPLLGRRDFLLLYVGGTFLGGLAYVLLHFNGGKPVVGASASVFALLSLFCLLRPNQPITLLLFFVIPITMKPKWVFWGFLGYSVFGLLTQELRGGSMMAHSAHLGGMFAGVLYFRFIHQSDIPLTFRRARSKKPEMELPEWFKRKKQQPRDFNYRVNRADRDGLQKEVDRILDKINTNGFGSLSEAEKHTLDQARDLLRK